MSISFLLARDRPITPESRADAADGNRLPANATATVTGDALGLREFSGGG
jgi:hypothetical protein